MASEDVILKYVEAVHEQASFGKSTIDKFYAPVCTNKTNQIFA